jgi:hypothetical protein
MEFLEEPSEKFLPCRVIHSLAFENVRRRREE